MVVADWPSQRDFAVRFDWGLAGLGRIAPDASVVVIVDVLRFAWVNSELMKNTAEIGDVVRLAATTNRT